MVVVVLVYFFSICVLSASVEVKRMKVRKMHLHCMWCWNQESANEWMRNTKKERERLANNNVSIYMLCVIASHFDCFVWRKINPNEEYQKKVKQDQKKWAITSGVESLSHPIIFCSKRKTILLSLHLTHVFLTVCSEFTLVLGPDLCFASIVCKEFHPFHLCVPLCDDDW